MWLGHGLRRNLARWERDTNIRKNTDFGTISYDFTIRKSWLFQICRLEKKSAAQKLRNVMARCLGFQSFVTSERTTFRYIVPHGSATPAKNMIM
jgi:hypothetical protein